MPNSSMRWKADAGSVEVGNTLQQLVPQTLAGFGALDAVRPDTSVSIALRTEKVREL